MHPNGPKDKNNTLQTDEWYAIKNHNNNGPNKRHKTKKPD
jgi:hypothetical protein